MRQPDDASPVVPLSERQRDEVQAELELVLASPLFRQSKRYPAFLRYVVETTLRGGEDELKERVIGMEVFGRQPNYDTSLDPTVRLTAAEVRKRLAQYYGQPEHAAKLHIELHPGSYVPGFAWPSRSELPVSPELPELPASAVPEAGSGTAWAAEPFPVAHRTRRRHGSSILAAVAALCLCAALFAYRHGTSSVADGDLWAPLLRGADTVAFVLPDVSRTDELPELPVAPEAPNTTVLNHIRNSQLVDFNDSVALAQLAGMLGRWNRPYAVLLSSSASFADLQRGPDVLVGAVDNPWTMRFLSAMPYSVARRGDTLTFAITGRQRTTDPAWSLDLGQPFARLQDDYGILARSLDTISGRPVLIVAGLGQNGTAAGIRLLTDPTLERTITEAAPKGWSGRNLEVVFRTQIIDDRSGPPVIVAREYW